MMNRLHRVLAAMMLLAPLTVAAQAANDTSRARNGGAQQLPLKPERTIRFTTDEGTWMSVDLSPDGRTIVFDLLGDLYTVPVSGGKATRITSGMEFDAQPRFSPDGRQILFVSDRSGAENLWLVDADGANPRALTRGDKGQYISPAWSPDGEYIVVSRSNTDARASSYELFLYHRDGGSGVRLAGAVGGSSIAQAGGPGSGPSNFVGAAFGPDPRYIYVAAKRGGFGYNLSLPQWQVLVLDRETGRTHARTNAWGSGMRPVVSRDGRWLVYATREDSVTSLRVRDLASGDERWLVRGVDRDDQESRYTRDNLPGSAFTPDSRALITSFHGRLWRVEVPSGRRTQIPFEADVEMELGPAVRFEHPVEDSTLTVRQIRDARPSPDGRRLAFTALGRLWVQDLPAGTPRRLTSLQAGEHSPVWSPDGRHVAFVTWTEDGGDVYRVRADGRGQPERLTRRSAFYINPSYTPDGRRLVVARGPRQPRMEDAGVYGLELVWIPVGGGAETVIAPLSGAGWPHFARNDSERIYIHDRNDGLVSMRFDGTDVKPVIKVTGFVEPGGATPQPRQASEILISPDGRRAIAQVGSDVYLVTVPLVGGQTLTVSALRPQAAAVPMRRITRIGGEFLGWYADGNRFHYSLGRSFFTYDIARADSLVKDSTARADSVARARAGRNGANAANGVQRDTTRAAADSAARARTAYEPVRTDVVLTVQRDRPRGVVALRGARIITMRGDEVIEDGDLVIRDNRVAAVGARGTIEIPAGAQVIDVAGKTVIPGWIDIHAHLRPSSGIHRTQPWEYAANLAYGVTTTRDPQTGTTDVLAYGDLVDVGEVIGPRIYSTGPGVFWSEDISSLDQARDVLRRYSDFYDTKTIKQYGVGDRKVRQWVIMAARELRLMPTSENYLDFKKNLTEAVDGYPGAEHSYPIFPLYRDVVQLIAQSGITYTPTLLVNFGGPSGEEWFYDRYDITSDAKLTRFTPRGEVIRRALRRGGRFHESQFVFRQQAAEAAKIVAAGGRVGLGGHGQLQGLGVHWELWAIASGGMPLHDVLRVGTIFGAEALGLSRDLGSLEPGKLADLQVLDANPLQRIENTNSIRYVMKNGRLYDAESLAELWPRRRPAPAQWWDREALAVPAEGEIAH